MSDWEAARAMMAWFFQNLEPGQNPVEFIEEVLVHLRSRELELPSVITTEHLGDPDAFMAQLEAAAQVFSTFKLHEWVDWHDANPGGDEQGELQTFIQSGDLPWCLHPYKDDPDALCQAIRAMPLVR